MQVLVADDDPVFRSLLQNLLGQWHFDVVLAQDGAKAWEILQGANPPQLIVLDWMMPEMDGYEVCQRLRGQKKTENAFVCLITGSGNKDEIMKVLVAGADDYLIKPFDPTDLKIHIRAAMRILALQHELNDLRQQLVAAPS